MYIYMYIYIYVYIYIDISVQNHCSQDLGPSDSWHWLGIPGSPNGAKKARNKKRFFLEWGRNAFVRHAAFSKHDAILQRIQPWPPKNPIPT